MDEAFLDTAYAIALSSKSDDFHQQAIELAEQMEVKSIRLITTWAVLFKIGNALSKLSYRNAAVSLLESLERDPGVLIIQHTEDLYDRAFRLFKERPDKEWSLTDCLSFVVMKDRGMTEALTTDHHFSQAGFNVLLHR